MAFFSSSVPRLITKTYVSVVRSRSTGRLKVVLCSATPRPTPFIASWYITVDPAPSISICSATKSSSPNAASAGSGDAAASGAMGAVPRALMCNTMARTVASLQGSRPDGECDVDRLRPARRRAGAVRPDRCTPHQRRRHRPPRRDQPGHALPPARHQGPDRRGGHPARDREGAGRHRRSRSARSLPRARPASTPRRTSSGSSP